MPREKRTAPVTVHMPRHLKAVISRLSHSDRRSVSTYVVRVLEEHPTVKIVLQQIGGAAEQHKTTGGKPAE